MSELMKMEKKNDRRTLVPRINVENSIKLEFQQLQQMFVAENCFLFSWLLWEQSFSSRCNGKVF
jgi:hypothetical protein